MTPAAFKRSIRDLQVWCSSCMVAFSGSDPIGVLIGAKRPSGTLMHKIAVHPDHRRQGHGRHLLTSLGSKLSILGPPRMVAEVPESFHGCLRPVRRVRIRPGSAPDRLRPRGCGADAPQLDGLFVIPVTVDDLAANGLLASPIPPCAGSARSRPLTARKNDIAGLAVASDERIEAYVLYVEGRRSSVAPDAHRGRWRASRAAARSSARGRGEHLPFAEGSSGRDSRRIARGARFPPRCRHRLYAAKARAE